VKLFKSDLAHGMRMPDMVIIATGNGAGRVHIKLGFGALASFDGDSSRK